MDPALSLISGSEIEKRGLLTRKWPGRRASRSAGFFDNGEIGLELTRAYIFDKSVDNSSNLYLKEEVSL